MPHQQAHSEQSIAAVAECKRRIEEQQRHIAELERMGQPTTEAQELLQRLREALQDAEAQKLVAPTGPESA